MSWGTFGISSEGHFLGQGREGSQASLPSPQRACPEAGCAGGSGRVGAGRGVSQPPPPASAQFPSQTALRYPVREDGGEEKRGRGRGLGN